MTQGTRDVAEVPSKSAEWTHGLVGAIVALYIVVVSLLAWWVPFWRDEIYTIRDTGNGLGHAIRGAVSAQYLPPGYFLIEAAWRLLFPAPMAARVPSIVFGAGAVAMGVALCRRLVPAIPAALAALLLASHPFLVWAGTEARAYALVVFLGTCLVYLAIKIHVDAWKRGRALFIGLSALSIYIHYYLGFVLVAMAVALLALRRYRELFEYSGEMLLALVLCVPAAVIAQQQVALREPQSHPLSPMQMVFSIESGLEQFSIAAPVFPENPAAVRSLRWLVRGLIVVGSGALVWGKRLDRRRAVSALVIATAASVVPFVLGAILTSRAGIPWYLRYWAEFAVPAILLPLVLAQGFGKSAVVLLASALIVSNSAATCLEHRTLGRWGDSRAVARALELEERPGEPILIVPADAILSLEFYYRGKNRLVSVPRDVNPFRYRESELMPHGPDDLAAVLRKLGAPSAFWLYSDMPEVDSVLDTWLAPWTKTVHQRFPGGRYGNGAGAVAHLRRYERTPLVVSP